MNLPQYTMKKIGILIMFVNLLKTAGKKEPPPTLRRWGHPKKEFGNE
jgi:hypothetical protein